MSITPLSDRLRLEFLFQWMLRFDLATITSGSSVPQLNKRDLAPLRILVPSLEVQDRFVRAASAVDQLESRMRSSAAGLDALFASLQHRAFTGAL
jgi:type I restriction enzyme S subunit